MNTEKFDIYSVNISIGNADLEIMTISRTYSNNPANFSKRKSDLYHSHLFYEIHIVREQSSFIINDKVLVAKSGSIVIISPYTDHFSYFNSSNNNNHVFSLMLDKNNNPDDFYPYYKRLLDDASTKCIMLSDNLFKQLIAFHSTQYKHTPKDIMKAKSTAYNVMGNLFDELGNFSKLKYDTANIPQKNLSENEELVVLQEFVNDARIPLSVIAESMNYSSRHLSRIIQRVYGKPFSEIRKQRMAISAQKLLQIIPTISYTELARRTGYTSIKTLKSALGIEENRGE